jgi:hypothetical protein
MRCRMGDLASLLPSAYSKRYAKYEWLETPPECLTPRGAL